MSTPHAQTARQDVSARWYVIGRDFSAWHALGLTAHGGACSMGEELDAYVPHALDGALVYDGERGDLRRLAQLVLNGPRVDVTLKPGSSVHQAWPLRRLRATESRAEHEALARVAPDVYAGLLRAVKGVRVGWARNGVVEWEGAA